MSKINRVVVFGLGAAGSNVLLHMAYTHPDIKLTGVDFDTVEQRNFEAGTQPYTKADLKRPKVQAMQRILQSARKQMSSNHARVTSSAQICDLVGRGVDDTILVDAFDNAESRNLFLALKGVYPILHVGFSATFTGEAVWAESYSEMTPDKKGNFDICQMHTARPFIYALTAMASLVITEFIDTGVKRNLYFDSTLKTFTF